MNTPTPKQIKAVELVHGGLSSRSAMLQAGYSPHTADNPKSHLWGLVGVQQYLATLGLEYVQQGITPDKLAKKTAEWLDAKKSDGQPDYQTQLRAGEMVRKDFQISEDEPQPPKLEQSNFIFGKEFSETVTDAIRQKLGSIKP